MVNNIVITFYGDRWLLDQWWLIYNVYKGWISILYTWNKYNIVHQLHFNKIKKLKPTNNYK